MSILCPKCRHVRQAADLAPEWQCPACGVAYDKTESTSKKTRQADVSNVESESDSPPSWVKAMLLIAAVLFAWHGLQKFASNRESFAGIDSNLSVALSDADLRTLAKTVKADEVRIYTTTDCPYCAEAKAWLRHYEFPFTECDAQIKVSCARELASLRATGVPYLIVRDTKLGSGFDGDRFVAALR